VASSKKGALKGHRTVLWADETGFYLLPMIVRTWAPVGQTPILRETVTHDHLSMLAAMTPQGQLYTRTLDHAFNGANVVGFLHHLLGRIRGPITLLWDGATIHRSKEVKAFLSEGAAKRLHLVALPGYAPDLNPTEALWSFLKQTELGNVSSADLIQLRHELQKALERVRGHPLLLQSFFQSLDPY
jgi:transposase